MKNGVCPNCNSTDVYQTDFVPLQAGGFLGLHNPNGNNFPLAVYLCKNCGHVEMEVAQSHVSRLAELVQSGNWQKVG